MDAEGIPIIDEQALMNDPALLAELHALMGGVSVQPSPSDVSTIPSPVKKPSSNIKPQVVDVPAELDISDVDVELDENELPGLMEELLSLGGSRNDSVAVQPKVQAEEPVTGVVKKELVKKELPKEPAVSKEIPRKPVKEKSPDIPAPVEKSSKQPVETKKIEEKPDLTAKLNALLQSQIDKCSQLAADNLKLGRKEEALHFHKYKKQFLLDQSLLTSETKYERVTARYSQISVNWEIARDQLVLSIPVVTGLSGSCYLRIDSPFTEQPVDTHVIKSLPFTHSFKIASNKTFIRYFERKRLQVEFWSPRFLLRPAQFLGKCSLALGDLLLKCSAGGPMALMDTSGRKATEGSCNLSLKLQRPMAREVDTEEVEETWIIFNDSEFFSHVTGGSKSAVSSPTKSSPPAAAKTKRVSANPKPVEKSVVTPKPTSELEELIFQFNNTQSISNNLLEHLLSSQPPLSPADTESIKMSLHVLVLQVQSGALTVEKYLENLAGELATWKDFALKFKKAGSMEYARKALERVKILEAEIKSANE